MPKEPLQTRLHLTALREHAEHIYAALELAFEDDGFPLALQEIDEAKGIHEVSLYADGDIDAAEERMRQAIGALARRYAVGREILPDADWVALSLEGLKPVRAGRFFVLGAHD